MAEENALADIMQFFPTSIKIPCILHMYITVDITANKMMAKICHPVHILALELLVSKQESQFAFCTILTLLPPILLPPFLADNE